MPFPLPFLENKKLLFITEITYGLGDFFAAKKVLTLLASQCPDLKIHWLIRAAENRTDIPQKINNAKTTFNENITVELINMNQEIATYDDVHLIVFFPTAPSLSTFQFQSLQSLNIPLLQLHEYDLLPLLHEFVHHGFADRDSLPVATTGFDGLGLFLEEMDHLQPNAIESILPAPFSLNNQNELFLSYVNHADLCVSNHADFTHYMNIVLRIAPSQKSVDVVANTKNVTLDTSFKNDAWDHGFSEIIWIEYDPNNQIIQHSSKSPRRFAAPRQLRIMNPFPLDSQQMQSLMIYAHPLQQVTGDQSLSELFSISALNRGIFPFYQIMKWKQGVHKNWLETAKFCLGKSNAYVRLLESIGNEKTLDSVEFAQIWIENQETILEDSIKLYNYLLKEKNLYSNIAQYLNLFLYVQEHMPSQRLKKNAILLVQLLVKLHDPEHIIPLLARLNNIEEYEQAISIMNALIHFLKMNPVHVDARQIHLFIEQLIQAELKERVFIARTSRQLLAIMPESHRNLWVNQLIPLLHNVPSRLHHQILSELENQNDIDAFFQQDTALPRLIDKNLAYEQSLETEQHFQNKMLLAVHVFDDGIGDIVKYISCYHLLKRAFPQTDIITLIQISDTQVPELLAVLRKNLMPLQKVYIWPLPALESIAERYNLMSEQESIRQLQHIGFNVTEKYSLIISLDTPFKALHFIRNRTPYIEIAEVNYCSYPDKYSIFPKDAQHRIVAMGLNEDAVGLDICNGSESSPIALFAQLSPHLANNLLDGEPTNERINHFLNHTFFMPSYVKGEEGALSIHYPLALFAHYFKDKETAVLWVHQLPFDITTPAFQAVLRSRGISSLIVYNQQNTRHQYTIEGASSARELRIVCGTVPVADFDLMYQLAQYTGGFVGCVGQSSFEKALSFNVIPVFYAPPWLLSLIYQCQSLITTLFSIQSPEYHCVNQYLNQLASFSRTIHITTALLKTDHFQPYLQHLKTLAPQDFQNELLRIAQENTATLENASAFIEKLHPLEIVEAIALRDDLELLRSTWQQVCMHIRDKKNVNTWLLAEAEKFLPTQAALSQHQDSYDDQRNQALLFSQPRAELTREHFPITHSFLTHLLNDIWPTHEKDGLQLIVTHCKRYFVRIMSGLGYPCISISQHAFLELSDNELHFALRFTAEQCKKYHVENASFDIKKLRIEQLWPAFAKELDYGISYCQKQATLLKDACNAFKQPVFFNDEYDELKAEYEFYQQMIKNIERYLANRYKHELNQQQFLVDEQNLRTPCFVEINEKTAHWTTEQEVITANQLPIDSLTDLIETIPQLRIKSYMEYDFPTIATQQFLKKMNSLVIDADDLEQRRLAERLINKAYEHRVACFDVIYLFVSKALTLQDQIMTVGPFAQFRSLIEQFLNATSFETVQNTAQKIEAFLCAVETRHLFINTPHPITTKDWYSISGNKAPVDSFVCSTVGARTLWANQKQLPDVGTERYAQYLLWCKEDDTRSIPLVLFRLGMMVERQIWHYIKAEDAGRFAFSFLNGIILGEIPSEYCHNPSPSLLGKVNDVRSTLELKFILHYFKHLYGILHVHPNTSSLSREHIETFISQNNKPLSMQGLTNKVSKHLMSLLEDFVSNSPEEGTRLVYQFYLDPDYPFGLHQLYKQRQTALNIPIMSNKFSASLGKGLTLERIRKKSPYVHFLLKHKPRYLPLNDLLEVLADKFNIYISDWPVDYFFDVLELHADKLESVYQSIETLKKYKFLIRIQKAQDFIDAAIINIYHYAVNNTQDIPLLSEATCRFIIDADLRETQMRIFCQSFCNRTDFSGSLNAYSGTSSVPVALLSAVYKTFDRLISWPNNEIRNLFSKVLLQELARATPIEQAQGAETLLFSRILLTDVTMISPLIHYWVTFQLNKYGTDDNSYSYYLSMSHLVQEIINNVPELYRKQMLENLLTQIEAQDQLSEFTDKMLHRFAVTPIHNAINSENLLINMANKLAAEHLSIEFVIFLSYELTSKSLDQFLQCLQTNRYNLLTGQLFHTDPIGTQEASFLAAMIYQLFWNHSIEERAVVLNHLLMPSSSICSAEAAEQAYQRSFDFLCTMLFSEKNDEQEMSKDFLNSYLRTTNPFVRPYLLAAIMSTNQMVKGTDKNIATMLPKLAEIMGAAGVKSGQAAHSYPWTPQNLRDGLACLKSKSRLPYRWELWALLKTTIPNSLLEEIKSVKQLLGGASFFIAVEVEMKQGDTAVLRLLRSNAQEEAQYGFAHLKATLNDCKSPFIKKINRDLAHLINEAEAGAQIEINHQCVEEQYNIAAKLYQGIKQEVTIGHSTFHITIKPVQLFSHGPGYQLISKAEGIEFNELKKDPKHQALCQAVALMVCKTELNNLLGDGPCDYDRHGAQTRILYQEVASNEFQVVVTHYDFGEISPTKATEAQLNHCHNFINETAATLFNRWNLLQSYVTSSETSLMEQFAKKMIEYISNNSPKSALESQQTSNDDLSRLRGIFKGLLALNDFLEVLVTNTRLMKQLKDVFDKHTTSSSFTTKLFHFFSSNTTEQTASSSAASSYFNRQ